ncbi:YbjP/YqhG family protein [Devosia sp. SL43]|uniref:YbjP/YqhG family protein n=1 Tax=Devosia sp. SL43 TaxID=2806348 RepID=UPI001F4634C0|nr:YbjP/YqhG family protein [Devosia sp. SL43]UJW86734.1 hypothetical protein IM737_05625 [Devosia sp. SL43]
MRLILALVAAAVVVAPAMAAETFSDPKALVTAIYDDYQPGKLAGDPTLYYSTKLKGIFDQSIENQVFASDAAMTGAEFKPASVFNPFLPDVSALLFDVAIGEATVIDDRAVINVSYHNFDQPRLVTIAMVREDGNWKVDDVASLGREDHWLLSWALMYDPTGF